MARAIKAVEREYLGLTKEIFVLLEEARRQAGRSINAIMTATYWEIGRKIVEFEQSGHERADYGKETIRRLSEDLTAQFGRGFSPDSLERMRQSYMGHRGEKISATQLRKFDIALISKVFPLPWSAYIRLLSVKNNIARKLPICDELVLSFGIVGGADDVLGFQRTMR